MLQDELDYRRKREGLHPVDSAVDCEDELSLFVFVVFLEGFCCCNQSWDGGRVEDLKASVDLIRLWEGF